MYFSVNTIISDWTCNVHTGKYDALADDNRPPDSRFRYSCSICRRFLRHPQYVHVGHGCRFLGAVFVTDSKVTWCWCLDVSTPSVSRDQVSLVSVSEFDQHDKFLFQWNFWNDFNGTFGMEINWWKFFLSLELAEFQTILRPMHSSVVYGWALFPWVHSSIPVSLDFLAAAYGFQICLNRYSHSPLSRGK